jgi:hypothetical protein
MTTYSVHESSAPLAIRILVIGWFLATLIVVFTAQTTKRDYPALALLLIVLFGLGVWVHLPLINRSLSAKSTVVLTVTSVDHRIETHTTLIRGIRYESKVDVTSVTCAEYPDTTFSFYGNRNCKVGGKILVDLYSRSGMINDISLQ